MGNFTEACVIMLLFSLGEVFENLANDRTDKNIKSFIDIVPKKLDRENPDGSFSKVSINEINVGDIILAKDGDRIGLDGVVVDGEGLLDTSSLTGESMPVDVRENSKVLSSSILKTGIIKYRVQKVFYQSIAYKIISLIKNSPKEKSDSEKLIRRFAKVYTPFVVAIAVFLAVVPPILFGNFASYLKMAGSFLILSCPCALVISVPLSFFAGIGSASRNGVLIKGSNFMEVLSNVDQVIFDKTGTLTKGTFEVTAIHPETLSENELLHIASHVERYSTHPIAESLRRAYKDENDACKVDDIKEVAGCGISAKVNGDLVYVGNSKMMDKFDIEWKKCQKSGTIIHVAINNTYQGHIVISDTIKENSKKAIKSLKDNHISKTIMLTGDSNDVGQNVSNILGLDDYYSELLPQDKVEKLEEILNNNSNENKKIAFVGDGINDAPSLTRADVGIAMGAMGSDAAIEAADVILMDDDPLKISTAIKISKKCLKIVKENIYFSIGVKIIVLVLGALGFASMWAAIFADVGVTFIAVLNAMRCMYIK